MVHLAVHPSAWTSSPPVIPQSEPQTVPHIPTHTSATSRPPTVNHSQPPGVRWSYGPTLRSEYRTGPSPNPRPTLAFVQYKHQQALSYLCPYLPLPSPLENAAAHKLIASDILTANGWSWPAVLDEEFPPSTGGGVEYKITEMGYVVLVPLRKLKISHRTTVDNLISNL